MIDFNTSFGQHAQQRLERERIVWLTTVDSSGTPQPRPVWFLWDGEHVLIFTRPEGHKLDHIRRNPHVSLNLDGNGEGGDIVVLTGQAEIGGAPPADQVQAYVEKYRAGFKRLGMDADDFAQSYSISITVTPTRLRGHA